MCKEKPYETHELPGNLTLEIWPDDNPHSPREDDNLGTMVCFHDRYDLGDKDHGYDSPNAVLEYLVKTPHIALNIFAYEHSGITIRASSSGRNPFADPWDSGQVGIIFITKERIRSEYGWKYITSARAKQIESYLKSEVETYDDYLTGQVYGYKVRCKECGEELDSNWGYYGYDWKKNGIEEDTRGWECDSCIQRKKEEQEAQERERIEQEEIDKRLDMLRSL